MGAICTPRSGSVKLPAYDYDIPECRVGGHNREPVGRNHIVESFVALAAAMLANWQEALVKHSQTATSRQKSDPLQAETSAATSPHSESLLVCDVQGTVKGHGKTSRGCQNLSVPPLAQPCEVARSCIGLSGGSQTTQFGRSFSVRRTAPHYLQMKLPVCSPAWDQQSFTDSSYGDILNW